jgi:hypothetical protein
MPLPAVTSMSPPPHATTSMPPFLLLRLSFLLLPAQGQPQHPMVVTTMPPPCLRRRRTPAMPANPPSPAEEVCFNVSDILPGWKQVFIPEHLPTILGTKIHPSTFRRRMNPTTRKVCVECHWPQTSGKTLLMKCFVGCCFTNLDEFESDFVKGMHDELEVKWEKAKKQMGDKELSTHGRVLAVGLQVPSPVCQWLLARIPCRSMACQVTRSVPERQV